VAPSSHGIGSHAPVALQRKPGSQLVAVHAAPHVEPTPVWLHGSAIAWQCSPDGQPWSFAQAC